MKNSIDNLTVVSVFNGCSHQPGGQRVVFEIPPHCSVDVDEPEDLIMCEALLWRYRMSGV